MVDIIGKKRDGKELAADEIRFAVNGYVSGEIPDYQMSAWAMAVYFRGMTARETADLTMAMAESGDQVDLSQIHGIKVDKHSTGGVGDTVSLVLAPLAAAAGVPVAKMSGRGLGHTGGTIDKLEAIHGFSVELTQEQFLSQVNRIGVAIISQSGNITPADKMLYGLRDVTATVDSIPLIASSIMSKKLAAGADAIVLDVKTGDGAFMKTLDGSIELARAMVDIGNQVGRETVALISGMDEPLGYAIGNALEVQEAVDTLRGQGPSDLTELCLLIGAHMLVLGGKARDEGNAKQLLQELIQSGQALQKFKEFIAAQGGDPGFVDNPAHLTHAERVIEVKVASDGYVEAIQAEAIGRAAMRLGAGRETKDSVIDLAAGLMLRRKVGDRVARGDVLAELHTNKSDEANLQQLADEVRAMFVITGKQPKAKPSVYAIVTSAGVRML